MGVRCPCCTRHQGIPFWSFGLFNTHSLTHLPCCHFNPEQGLLVLLPGLAVPCIAAAVPAAAVPAAVLNWQRRSSRLGRIPAALLVLVGDLDPDDV